MEPLVRCGGCGQPPSSPLRRGRCQRCYDAWVKARVVGQGATCSACDDRRLMHLRYWEIGVRANVPGGRWVVLCHNCVAVAEKMDPPPRSVDSLKMRLHRDRRWGDRRAEAVGENGDAPKKPREAAFERRFGERRRDPVLDGLIDAIIIEMEADFEEVTEGMIEASEEITGIHIRIPLPE